MWADFSAKGCPQHSLLWCAGSIAIKLLLGLISCIHSHVVYYLSDILAYMWVDFIVKRLPKIYSTLVCRDYGHEPHIRMQ